MKKNYIIFILLSILILITILSIIYYYKNTKEGLDKPTDTPTDTPTDKSANNNNIDVTFHISAEDLDKMNGEDGSVIKEKTFTNDKGELIKYYKTFSQGDVTYYEPGEYKYGAASYIPSYEDSIMLSNSTYE